MTQVLWHDFIHYRDKTAQAHKLRSKGFLRPLVQKPERLRALERLAVFCEKHSVSPRLYLYSLFQVRKWLYAPRWEHLNDKAFAKHLPRLENITDISFYRERMNHEARRAEEVEVPRYDPNRDISNTVESLKRRYLSAGDSFRCVSRMATETFGYHPRSAVCAQCPLQQQCKTKLLSSVSFDILALRRGEITARQAQLQSAGVGYGT